MNPRPGARFHTLPRHYSLPSSTLILDFELISSLNLASGARRDLPLPTVSEWWLAVFLISFNYPDRREEARGSSRGLQLPVSCLLPAGLGARVEDLPPAIQEGLWESGQSHPCAPLYWLLPGCPRRSGWAPSAATLSGVLISALRAPRVLLIAAPAHGGPCGACLGRTAVWWG